MIRARWWFSRKQKLRRICSSGYACRQLRCDVCFFEGNQSDVITCRRLLFVERPLNVLGRISTQRFKLFHSNVCERLNMNAPLDARRIARFYHFGGYEVRGYSNRWCTRQNFYALMFQLSSVSRWSDSSKKCKAFHCWYAFLHQESVLIRFWACTEMNASEWVDMKEVDASAFRSAEASRIR